MTKGVEGLFVGQVAPSFSWHGSASYNSSIIQDNYSTQSSTGSTVIPAKGKDAVDAPRLLANSGVRYADGPWSADVSARRVDKRYFTILNNLSVPAYTVPHSSLGYPLP